MSRACKFEPLGSVLRCLPNAKTLSLTFALKKKLRRLIQPLNLSKIKTRKI